MNKSRDDTLSRCVMSAELHDVIVTKTVNKPVIRWKSVDRFTTNIDSRSLVTHLYIRVKWGTVTGK